MTRDGLLPYVETGWYRCTFRTLPQYESLGVARRWATYQNDSENNDSIINTLILREELVHVLQQDVLTQRKDRITDLDTLVCILRLSDDACTAIARHRGSLPVGINSYPDPAASPHVPVEPAHR